MILEKNVDIVDKAINAVNSLLGAAMSWEQIANVIKTEKKNGNPVAAIVSGLKLEENKITVALSENDAEEEEAEEEEEEQQTSKQKFGKKKMLIDVLLNQSAQGNVRLMFQDKKKAAAKATVTVEKSHQAVEDMLLKLQSETKKNKVKQQPAVRSVRKPYWFEKFHWFLTSEGILVLGGRDAHQNELLFKKFLRKGDAYMHADIHGAPTVIVRNPFPKTGTAITIPIESMRQAGLFCICKSPAWVSKIVTSAWWVESYQVSRTAPSGEYLPTGSFMIRGKKNYLQPTKLEMGFGYIFKIDLTAREEQDNKEGEENEKRKDENEKEWRYLRGKVSPPELFQSGNGGVEDAASSSLVTVIDVGVKAKKDSIPSKKNERTTAKNQSSQQQTKSNPFQQQAQEKPKQVASTTQSKKKLLKQKRIAQKYGDQTEEEKRLALIALGHLKLDATEHQKQAENEEEVAGEKGHSDDENDDTGDAVATSWLVKNAIDPSTRAPEPKNMPKNEEDGDDEKESNDGKEVQKEKVQEEDEENEEDQVEEEEVLLKGFTAIPSSDDVILYALPFCGPMDAMAHFKFRVKLTPGTLKKGKAAKQAVSLFQSIASEREKAIIYGISDPENVAVMMMDVKVSAPGIEKIRAQEKNKKKTQKQVSNNNNPPATEEEEL